ncbi:MAG TPA: hypothetical protein DEG71_00115 [Clostridiales bacterium]|nr:hypothetical protein [Clostridiales bacterium]
MALTDEKDIKIDIKKEEAKTSKKGKFDIIEAFENSAYVLIDGQVRVVDKKVKKGQKKIELEYEIIDGDYKFK